MSKKPTLPPMISIPEGMREPDYERWGAADVWTLSEAAALLMGWEPVPDEAIPAGPARKQFFVIREKLQRDTGKTITHFHYTSEQGHLYYPWDVIEWAESSRIPFDEKLKTAVFEAWPSRFRTGAHLAERDRLKKQIAQLESALARATYAAQPPYMKSEHAFFAPELEEAVRVWTMLYSAKPSNPTVAHKHGVVAALSDLCRAEHRQTSSNEKIQRIATVTNPKKRGGRPPGEVWIPHVAKGQ